ncbi:protease, partial [Halobacteriales archaeon SW_10_68_16]
GTVAFAGFQYKFGKWAALRSVGAEDMPEEGQYREIHRTVEHLSQDMGIEKPRLMVADMGMPNAFAVGRKGAGTVVVSREIIQLLETDELDGVLAHELAHIKNRDVVMMVMGQSLASMVGIAVQFAVIFGGERNIGTYILAMIAGSIAQMLVMIFVFAISRYREYVADGDAADYTNNPDAMARAQSDQGTPDEVAALCIFGGERGLMQKVFATHPPVEKRIERLRSRSSPRY